MTYSYAKAQGQWSVGSQDGVETDGWTNKAMYGGGNAVG